MAEFRFVHFSDIHFARLPKRIDAQEFDLDELRRIMGQQINAVIQLLSDHHSPDKLTLLSNFLFANASSFHAMVITGDLADSGLPADLAGARALVYEGGGGEPIKLGSLTRGWVDEHGVKPIVLLPGNHDRFRGARRKPGGTDFDSAFGGLWDPLLDHPRISKPYYLNDRNGDGTGLVFVSVDLCLQAADEDAGLLGHLGQGRMLPEIAAYLPAVLEGIATKGATEGRRYCVVLCLHFDPSCTNPFLQIVQCSELDQLIASAGKKRQLSLILCGHTHSGKRELIGNVPLLVSGATVLQTSPGHSQSRNQFWTVSMSVSPDPTIPVRGEAIRYGLKSPGSRDKVSNPFGRIEGFKF